MKHKIMIQEISIKLTPIEDGGFGKIKIVAGFPEKSTLSYETLMIETRADVVEKQRKAIEVVLKKALDDIEEICLKKAKKR